MHQYVFYKVKVRSITMRNVSTNIVSVMRRYLLLFFHIVLPSTMGGVIRLIHKPIDIPKQKTKLAILREEVG